MSHWYHKDGTSCFEVPMKSDPSKMRDTTLRDARKMGLLPSVTTVLSGMIDKPFLTEWAKDNVADAAVTIPDHIWDANRNEPAELKKMIRAQEREIVEKAQVFGSAVHNAIEDYLGEGTQTADPLIFGHMIGVQEWIHDNVERVIMAEGTLIADLYAGRFDLIAVMKDQRVGMIDFKTRKRGKPTTKAEKESGLGKFGKYETDGLQLGGYKQAADGTEGLPEIDFCANLFVDSGTTPTPLELREYSNEDMAHNIETWNALTHCWCLLHKYNPTQA